MLTNPELKDLSRTSALRTWLGLITDWCLIIAGFWLVSRYPSPIVQVCVFVLMARQQLALAILMHDASHRRLFQTVRWNDIVGQILAAAPVGVSLFSYRTLHLKHHQDPLVADDPDLSLTGGYPISKSSFARKLLRDLFGISYFKFIRYFFRRARRRKVDAAVVDKSTRDNFKQSPAAGTAGSFAFVVVSIVFVQSMIFTALYLSGHPWLYLFQWILPSWTMLQVLLRIRGITEHAGYQPNPNQLLNSRTVINPLQTFFFAPHHVNYHMEHHQYPSIPHWRLPTAHRLMRERGSLPEKNIFAGYGSVLRDLVR